MYRTELILDRPLDLRRTIRLASLWGASPWLAVEQDRFWYARQTPHGPGTVGVAHTAGRLQIAAWGPGAEAVAERVPELLGLGDAGVASITPAHDIVAELCKRLVGYRQGRTGEVYPALVATALAQKVTGKEGKQAVHRIARAWGSSAPGPHPTLRLLPEPSELARRPYHDFHPLGIERHRAELVRRIASRASALQRAAAMPPAEGRAHLEKLRGIGPWTSGVVMGGPLGDPDAVPIGDFNLPSLVAFNLNRQRHADDAEMMALLEPYRGQRGRVVRMLKSDGVRRPRRGPRAALRDIREM